MSNFEKLLAVWLAVATISGCLFLIYLGVQMIH